MTKTLDAKLPKIVSRKEWLAKRVELLKAEKELTHKSDELARRRRELGRVRIDKDYGFETEEGKAKLADLFRGRSQLIVYHFMFGPDFKAGCPSCSSLADSFNGIAPHLAHHDVMFWAVSRGPLAKLQAFKKRMGWSFPWASSGGSEFNYDFCASYTEEQQSSGKMDYNYQSGGIISDKNKIGAKQAVAEPLRKIAASTGTDWPTYSRECPGMSSFLLDDGVVYHTYSAYARGLDVLWSMYQWLDRAPLGRNETDFWLRRRDEYED